MNYSRCDSEYNSFGEVRFYATSFILTIEAVSQTPPLIITADLFATARTKPSTLLTA